MKAVAGAALLVGGVALEIATGGAATTLALAMVGFGVSLIASQISESLTNQRGMGITVKEAYVVLAKRAGQSRVAKRQLKLLSTQPTLPIYHAQPQ